MTTSRLLIGLAIVVGGGEAGCGNQINPAFCAAHPTDPDCPDGGVTGCTRDDECPSATPACDVASGGTCVECIAPDRVAACSGAKPVCGDDHACRACAAHADCASSACLPDGSCAAEDQVAYVAPVGTGIGCSRGTPCQTLAAAVATNKPIVKIAAGLVKDNKTTIVDRRQLMILAEPGAVLDRDGDGTILLVTNAGADVAIFDLEITGGTGLFALGADGAGAKLALTRVVLRGNQVEALVGLDGASVSLSRCTVAGNGDGISVSEGVLTIADSSISGNARGVIGNGANVAIARTAIEDNSVFGVSVDGGAVKMERNTIRRNSAGAVVIIGGAEFDVTNNVVVDNGSPSATLAAVTISQTNAGMRRFEFNTISRNTGTANVSGVQCSSFAQAATFSNNIVFGNVGGGASPRQVSDTNCAWSFSDIGPQTLVPGTGNLNTDPMFVNPLQGDFHLLAPSPCRDAADPAGTLADDLDGDARPEGNRRDIGADEVTP